jgi:hypothetical protein
MHRAGLLFLAACALVLSSCDSELVEPRRDYTANVLAMTIPEGLPAGAEAIVWVHWSPGCGDEMGSFVITQEGPHAWSIRPVAMKPAEPVACLDNVQCFPHSEPLRLRVPATGIDHYRLISSLGDVGFDLAPSGPIAPGHRVTVVRAGNGTPFVQLSVRYYNGAREEVASAETDSNGTAVMPTPPCPGASDGTILSFQQSSFPCGYGAILFDPVVPLCNQAYHTIAFYGEIPRFHEP